MDVRRVPVEVTADTGHGKTNAYVVGDSGGLLVDPAARVPDLERAIDGRDVDHVAVTHHHADHVGGVATYVAECDATVWARAGREARFENATGIAPDRTFRDGTTIPVGDDGVTVVETPGHAPEHVAFDVGGELLVGDLAVATGSVAVGAPDGDLRSYLTSLRRLVVRDPETLYPGHGPVIENPRAACERLLAHRLDREARILAAVEAGSDSVDSILERAYDKDLAGVRDLARATVRAHLEKLAAEGKVAWDGDRVASSGRRRGAR